MPRVTSRTQASYDVLPAAVRAQISVGQLQRASEAGLGPLVDPAGHWRAYSTLLVGESRRAPDHDDAAISLALAGFPTTRLRQVVRQALGADTWPTTRVALSTAPETSLDVAAGKVIEDRTGRMGAVAGRLVDKARVGGNELAEGIATSLLLHIGRFAGTGTWGEPALGEGPQDVADEMLEALSGSFSPDLVRGFLPPDLDQDAEPIAAAMRQVTTSTMGRRIITDELHSMTSTAPAESDADPGTALLNVVETATPETLAGAVRSGMAMANLAATFGLCEVPEGQEGRRLAAMLAPACLRLPEQLGFDQALPTAARIAELAPQRQEP